MTELALQIKHLSKRFGAVVATDNVSLDVRQGEIHALIGPNGAGKSSLIQQIAGSLAPDDGQVLLNGVDVSTSSVAQRARAGLARSFQVSSVIAGFSALENVILAVQGNNGSTFRFFKSVLRQPELTERANGYLEQVELGPRAGTLVSELSHGERRKLELGMALAQEPQVFVLDEPMAGVGMAGSTEMTSLLAELKQKAPILLVEHDMDAVFTLADRISVLVYGKLIATGSVDEIRRNKIVQEAYLGGENPHG